MFSSGVSRMIHGTELQPGQPGLALCFYKDPPRGQRFLSVELFAQNESLYLGSAQGRLSCGACDMTCPPH